MRTQTGPLRWVALISIALNLFLLAFIGVQAWRLRHPSGEQTLAARLNPTGALGTRAVLRQLADKMPAEDAAKLRAAFIARLPALRTLRRDSAAAMERVRLDIAREPYDGETLRTDMEAARETRRELGPLLEELLLGVLPTLSDQGRRILGEYRLMPPQ